MPLCVDGSLLGFAIAFWVGTGTGWPSGRVRVWTGVEPLNVKVGNGECESVECEPVECEPVECEPVKGVKSVLAEVDVAVSSADENCCGLIDDAVSDALLGAVLLVWLPPGSPPLL